MDLRPEEIIREGAEYYDEDLKDTEDPRLFFGLGSLGSAALLWYPFRKNCRILQAGCGLGALTGVLCDHADRADVVEPDPHCSELVRKRYQHRKNLRVHNADPATFKTDVLYDYIVVTGLFERSGGREKELFGYLRTLLAPGGVLLWGFRNRFALKYSCGMTDEIVKTPGEAMDASRKLYTREEAAGILADAGYGDVRWYYPLPDLPFVQAVFTDEELPEKTLRDRIVTVDPYGNGNAEKAIREYQSYDRVIRSGLLPKMSNAYLAECRPDPAAGGEKEDRITAVLLSSDREREHAFSTEFHTGPDGKRTVVKRALYREGDSSVRQMYRNLEELRSRGLGAVPQKLEADEEGRPFLVMPRMPEPTLAEQIRTFLKKDRKEVFRIFDCLKEDILRSSGLSGQCGPELETENTGPVLERGSIDMIPNNAFFADGRIVYFDQEFILPHCPADYVLYRALRYTWLHLCEAEERIPLEEMKSYFGLSEKWDRYTVFEDRFTEKNRRRRLFAPLYRWAWGRKPYRTGFIMGTFDLFHKGHLNLIERAKKRCDFLRVGVLSDELVRKYKKITPKIPAKERLEIVGAIRSVDEAVLIEGEYVSKVAEWYKRPYDCFFSGDDYIDNEFWKKEKKELEELGSGIEFFPYTESVSSSMIREQLRREEETGA